MDSVNPLCKLSSLEKSRICALVFNFKIRHWKRPTPLSDLGCAQNPITFSTEDGQNAAHGDRYYEWMISCYESVPASSTFAVYYLSYSHDKSNASSSNYVFTHSRASNTQGIVLTDAYNDIRIDNLFSSK